MDSSELGDGRRDAAQARVTYRLSIVVEGDEADGVGFRELAVVDNVTRRGAFVETPRRIAPGALLALRDAHDPARLLAYALVVWTRPADGGIPGAGVKLVGNNSKWMDYLIAHSVQAADEPAGAE